jgi:hypothetical protein
MMLNHSLIGIVTEDDGFITWPLLFFNCKVGAQSVTFRNISTVVVEVFSVTVILILLSTGSKVITVIVSF